MRPSHITATRSARVKASSWSWVTKMAAAPARFKIWRTSVRTLTRSRASRLEKGSSNRINAGDGASARARATRCASPPDSSCG